MPDRCLPPWWARGGHLQTLLGVWLARRHPEEAPPGPGDRALEVPMRDGDRLRVWERGGPRRTRVLLMHGVGGSTSSPYMRDVADALGRAGYPVWLVNHRGSGGLRHRQSRPFHAGRGEDLADVLAAAREAGGAERHVLVGFSLSGNTLMRWLGEAPDDAPEGAIAVNAPVDLASTAAGLTRWPTRIYDRPLVAEVRGWALELRGPGPSPPAYSLPPRPTLQQVDDLYIAPSWGFADRQEYYAAASCGPWLEGVRTPSVWLTSADDPIVRVGDLDAVRFSPWTTVCVERHGGHLGYVGHSGASGRRWLPGAVAHLVGELEGPLVVDTPAARP